MNGDAGLRPKLDRATSPSPFSCVIAALKQAGHPRVDAYQFSVGFAGIDPSRRNRTVLRNRDDFSLQMIDEQGRLRFLLFSEMRRVTVHEKSFMPDNYESLLRPDQLQDLLAYLSRQTVAAPSQKEEGTMKKGPDVNLQ